MPQTFAKRKACQQKREAGADGARKRDQHGAVQPAKQRARGNGQDRRARQRRGRDRDVDSKEGGRRKPAVLGHPFAQARLVCLELVQCQQVGESRLPGPCQHGERGQQSKPAPTPLERAVIHPASGNCGEPGRPAAFTCRKETPPQYGTWRGDRTTIQRA